VTWFGPAIEKGQKRRKGKRPRSRVKDESFWGTQVGSKGGEERSESAVPTIPFEEKKSAQNFVERGYSGQTKQRSAYGGDEKIVTAGEI